MTALQLFLRSLAPALEAAGDGTAARTVTAASQALEPFGSLGLDEFAAFLARAVEFQRDGSVRIPGAGDLAAERLTNAAQQLTTVLGKLDAPNATQDLEEARTAIGAALRELAGRAGLAVTLKADAKWADAQVSAARIGPRVEAIRQLAVRIRSPEDYAAIGDELARLTGEIAPADLKPIGTEFGVKATAKTPAAKMLADVLAKLSGHEPAKAKPAKKGVDPAIVEAHGRRLTELFARAAGPDGLPDAEVAEEMARLEGLAKPMLLAIVALAGIDGVKSSDKVDSILHRVRNRLTVAQRAKERTDA